MAKVDTLPNAIKENICTYLTLKEVLYTSSLSKQWQKFISEGEASERIWHTISDVTFGGKKNDTSTWRQACKTNTVIMRKYEKSNPQNIINMVVNGGHSVILQKLWAEEKWHKVLLQNAKKILQTALKDENFAMLEWCAEVKIEADWVAVIAKLIKTATLAKFVKIIKITEVDLANKATMLSLLLVSISTKNEPILHYLLANATKDVLSEYKRIMREAINTDNKEILCEIRDCYKRVGGDKMWDEAREVKIEVKNKFSTLLMHAACNGCPISVQFLLENGADINEVNESDEKVIHLVCIEPKNSTQEIIGILLQYGANINEVPPFVEWRAPMTPLHRAACSGNAELVKYLVSKRAIVTMGEDEKAIVDPVIFATPYPAMISLLLDLGANSRALNKDNCNIFHSLISYSCFDFDSENNIVALFERLQAEGVNPKHKDIKGRTPACIETKKGIPKYILQWLVEKGGVDVNEKDEEDNTALTVACMSPNCDSVEYLLSKGADVNLLNKSGANALYYAVQGDPDKYQMVEALIKAGAKQLPLHDLKSTPLHAHIGDVDCSLPIVKLLVENGANLFAEEIVNGEEGWTPLKCAEFWSKTAIVDYLTTKMAEL